MPQNRRDHANTHLQSRLIVEKSFGTHGEVDDTNGYFSNETWSNATLSLNGKGCAYYDNFRNDGFNDEIEPELSV